MFLVFFQILILQNIQMGGYINPYMYVLFILLLPLETEKSLVLGLAFVLGLSIDIFTSSMGLHAIACVAMAYSRFYVLKLISPRDGYEVGMKPNVHDLGWTWFLIYASILIIIHHFVLFNVEVFRLGEFFFTFFRTLVSGVFTLLLIIIAQFITYRGK